MNAEPSSQQLREMDLRQGFDAFIEAARSLEESYAALKRRAEEVDLRLAETNEVLETTLEERETVFRALPVGVLATDGRGRTRFGNPEAERLQAAAGVTDLAGLPEGDHELGTTVVRVRRVGLPDGGRLAVLEDRSHLTRLEEEVHRLDRLAGLSELALGIAHEIKNPLNGVLGFADLMQRARDQETCRRHAGKIVEGLHQVDAIVKALLAFARSEGTSGRVAPVATLVREAAVEAGLPHGRIELRGDTGAPGEGDALVRVLSILFRNSVEASSGVHVAVEVAAGAMLEIVVADDGPGVPGELGPRIFEPFVTSKDRGHGLGLALAARVVAYLGGRLELLEGTEPGARFRVTMPAVGAGREGP